MILLTVNAETEASRAALSAVRKCCSTYTGPAASVVAEAAGDLTREHFRKRAAAKHRPAQPHNYWLRAADSVIAEAVDGGAKVSIPHTGVALRYFGGTVQPSGRISLVTGKPIQRLAVPFSGSEAEGKTPAEFDGLFVLSRLVGASMKKAALCRKTASGGFVGLFALLEKTEHEPDKSVLPSDAEYESAAVAAIGEMIAEEALHNGF